MKYTVNLVLSALIWWSGMVGNTPCRIIQCEDGMFVEAYWLKTWHWTLNKERDKIIQEAFKSFGVKPKEVDLPEIEKMDPEDVRYF